jgi:hypothetical protein
MIKYYNTYHISKQFQVREFVKLSMKNLNLKYQKLSPCWVSPFHILERIGNQAYKCALPEKYAQLHLVFPIQLLETYHYHQDDAELITMPDLEDP